ncbi:MAG: hypothetical protein ACT4OS_09065 [Acidimicrobiales bacterium]
MIALAALALEVLSGCGRGGPGGRVQESSARGGAASTPEAVAIQIGDLPTGFEKCSYSGSIDSYLAAIRDVDPITHSSLADRWGRLKAAKATAGYAAFFADSQAACTTFMLPIDQRNFGSEEDHIAQHPRIASSFVFRFVDDASARSAFAADYFGQSALADEIAMDVAVGTDTRLGPNSISVATQGSPIQIRQAVWQKSAWNVLFRSAAIERKASENVTAAIDLRMG